MKIALSTVDEALEHQAVESEVFQSLVHSRMSRILVIEDCVDLNRSLAARLRKECYKVQSAYDGMEGLDKIRERTPDLVVLDLGLPRLGGYALLHCMRIALDLNSVPVIILTGNDDPELEKKAKAWGVRCVLRKPIRQKKVVKAIKDVLERPS